MSAVTSRLVETTELEKPSELALDGLSGHFGGVLKELPDLGVAHAGLTRTVWIRRAIENFLAQRTYQIVQSKAGGTAGQLAFKLDKPMPKDVVPWMTATDDWDQFSLWGESGKMACPTWDLPAGALWAGGACPGADAGQTIVDPRQRIFQLAQENGKLLLPNPPPGSTERIALREGETICQGCVSGDTLVLVRGEGLVRIDSLVGRSQITVWSGKGWRTTHAVMTGIKPTFHLVSSSGYSLRLTGDHEVLMKSGERIRTDNLQEDERLTFELPDEPPFAKEVELPKIDLGERYRTELRGELPRKWSRELGVLLGYLVGDGWYYKHLEYPTIGICAAERDRGDLDRLSGFVSAWTGSNAEVKVHIEEPNNFCANPQSMVRVLWRQKSAVALVQSVGFDKNGPDTISPTSIWTASQEAVAGYLSGLFSTDGSVGAHHGVEISFANTAKRLVDEVQQLLFAFGIKSSICEYKSNRERGYLNLWKVSIRARDSVLRFRDQIGFFNQRKAQKLDELIQSNLPRYTRLIVPTVASVEPTGKSEPVYDLINVGEEHQFTANGLSISNCYALEGNYPSPHVQTGELLRYWWLRGMLNQRRDAEIVSTIVTSMRLIRYPVFENILPVRIHSAGDFFSQRYADVWIEVANQLWGIDKRIRMWAPTRSWAARGWTDYWKNSLGRLVSAQEGTPNLIVRPSAYHFNDPAPGPLHPSNAKGSTSLMQSSIEGRDQIGKDGDFRSSDPRVDYHCPTYSIKEGKHTCFNATNPAGGKHCRVCWSHPNWSVQYTAH